MAAGAIQRPMTVETDSHGGAVDIDHSIGSPTATSA